MQRIIPLENEHFYHIYNRGTDKRRIFMDDNDYIRFLVSMREFNSVEPVGSLLELNERRKKKKIHVEPRHASALHEFSSFSGQPLVKILCYALIPNHYHFILEQLEDKGISKFMQKLGLGYTMYFNKKHKRTGSLFQGKFKSAHIKDTTKLCWLSSYVNCNAEIHKIEKAEKWPWSSYPDFIGTRDGDMADKKEIYKYFTSTKEYIDFSQEVIREAQENKEENKDLLE